MFNSFLISLFVTLSTLSPLEKKLQADEAAHKITLEERLHYLELAVKKPSTLPGQYKGLKMGELGKNRRSATPSLISIHHERHKAGLSQLPILPDSPDQLSLASERYPIVVYYDHETLLSKAELTLEAAEYSWEKEVDNFGFYAPRSYESEVYEIYLTDCGFAGGYMSPGWDIDETPWDDCTSYVCISKGLSSSTIPSVVAHELSHATQGAMDCLEPLPIWENTSMYMEMAVYPGIEASIGDITFFQRTPYWSLADGTSAFRSDGNPYIYHGLIWPLFLATQFGEDPYDASIVARLWELSMQEAGNNTLDYLKAAALLAEEHGTSMDETFFLFSIARYFVDHLSDSPQALLPNAKSIRPIPDIQGSYALDMGFTYESIPSQSPKPFGVNYIKLLNRDIITGEIRVQLSGTNSTRWGLGLVALDGTLKFMNTGDQGSVELTFDGGTPGDLLLIVMNLGGENFSANTVPLEGSPYTLTVDPVIPTPLLSLITPGTMETDSEQTLDLHGLHFTEETTFSFLPEGQLEIVGQTFVSATRIELTLRTKPDTLTGEYQVVVHGQGGYSNTLKDGLIVVKKTETTDPESSCSSSPSQKSSGLSMLLLLFVLVLLRRPAWFSMRP